MKIVLASLMCLVLCASECFALKGGPPYPQSINVAGGYSGTFVPVGCDGLQVASNSLGLFSVTIPSRGVSEGSIVIFTGNRTFTGDIHGAADTRTGSFRAVIEAIPRVSITGVTVTTLNVHADGSLQAMVRNITSRGFTSVSTTHLLGTAHIVTTGTVDSDGTTCYTVDGVKD